MTRIVNILTINKKKKKTRIIISNVLNYIWMCIQHVEQRKKYTYEKNNDDDDGNVDVWLVCK